MVQTKKFRGVRQRQWGAWVSEIRHPLLKRRIWLGTFETAEAAARAYDQAAILMNGHNTKTNFPVPEGQADDQSILTTTASDEEELFPLSPSRLSAILSAKLRRKGSCKDPSPASLTCLRLDTDNSHIGVWQKRTTGQGASGSNWITRVQLGHQIVKNNNPQIINHDDHGSSSSTSSSTSQIMKVNHHGNDDDDDQMDEENRVAMQMIEELLNRN